MYLAVKENLGNFFTERQNRVSLAGRMNFRPEIGDEGPGMLELDDLSYRIGTCCTGCVD